jgi:uncharacterized protein (UPF0332 family)
MSSVLLNKSDFNFESANILQKQSKYCSVVHCAYYSSIQLMKYLLLYKAGKTDAMIIQERSVTGEGSHEYMINTISKFLKDNKHPDAVIFFKGINDLKKMRVKADYEEIQIDDKIGRNSILLSEQSNKILKKYI